MKLSAGEKLILIMLCEIYEKLGIKKEIDPELVKDAVFRGHLWGLEWAYNGLFGASETNEGTVRKVVDIMDMWSFLEEGYKKLSEEEKARVEKEAHPFGADVRFHGFDGNGESEYIGIARFLTEKLDRFIGFKGRDFNANMPTLDAHRRMLRIFVPLRKNLAHGPLTVEDIVKILNAQTHPELQKKKAMPSGGEDGPNKLEQLKII